MPMNILKKKVSVIIAKKPEMESKPEVEKEEPMDNTSMQVFIDAVKSGDAELAMQALKQCMEQCEAD